MKRGSIGVEKENGADMMRRRQEGGGGGRAGGARGKKEQLIRNSMSVSMTIT